MNKKLFCRN